MGFLRACRGSTWIFLAGVRHQWLLPLLFVTFLFQYSCTALGIPRRVSEKVAKCKCRLGMLVVSLGGYYLYHKAVRLRFSYRARYVRI